MRATSLLLATLFGLTACRTSAPEPVARDDSSRRTVQSGEVVGFTGSYGSHVWLGVPFARPPVGDLRWRAPEPPMPWSGVREALEEPPACPQFPSPLGIESGGHDPVGQEDCLYLNVYAPRAAPGEVPHDGDLLPVMVWIHGGGNVIGRASVYDGGNLAATERVVVVALQYRLGPFGWFRHASLRESARSDEERSGNYGTLDLIRGLEWVRDNAAAFGGDPARVTIFGESAGGRDVFSLVLSPRARGLFHRAIVQSGGTNTAPVEQGEAFADSEPAGDRNSSNEILLRVLRRDGQASSREEAKQILAGMRSSEIESTLRARTPADLLPLYQRERQEALIDVPQLFGDGIVLPEGDPLDRLRAGEANRVPVIFGTNRDENKLFLALHPDYVWRLFWVLPRVRDPERYDATAEHLSTAWKAAAADRPAAILAATDSPAWVYRFDWDEEPDSVLVHGSALLGAAHAFEIPFVFGHWNLGSSSRMLFNEGNQSGRLELSKKMMSYWTAFARDGDPNGDGLPRWDTFDAERGGFLVFDTEAGGGVRASTGTTEIADVIAAVDGDPRLATQEAKCEVYARLVEWSRVIPREDYPGIGTTGCREFPLAEPTIE